MRKKLSLALLIFLVVISFSITAFAVSFPDVDDTNWGWAKSIIEEMSSKGFISGFPDGTFGPSKPVTKLQSLILMARILGVNDESNQEYVELAEDAYTDDLLLYSTANKKEIAYLLYKNVLSTDELDVYIAAANANAPLKRYEAAILLTKAMGKEQEVKNKFMTVLPYQDIDSIPSHAKPYVEYVRNENIMKGMTETEFGPMSDVTRAQMAVMLYRVLQKNETTENQKTGTIIDIDENTKTIKIKDIIDITRAYAVNDQTIFRLDGAAAALSDFTVGTEVKLTLKSDKLYMIEGLSPQIDESVEGIITDIERSGSTRKIEIRIEGTNTSTIKEYIIDNNVVVMYNDKISTINALDTEDYAKLDIKNGRVKRIEAEDKYQEVEGVVADIILDPVLKLQIRGEDDAVQEYEVLDDVIVKKNKRSSDLRSIAIGDEVVVTLEYYKVKRIDATSVKSSTTGIIEEIVISKTPSIKIKKDNEITSYNLKRDADIEIDDETGQIYDLRLGYTVELTIEGNTIVKLEAKTLNQAQQITGRVELVNESYGLIRVSVADGVTGDTYIQQVFVKKGAKIIRSKDTREIDLDDIDVGDIITAVGTSNTGVFEANTVIIITE
jgi:hypothetical protein